MKDILIIREEKSKEKQFLPLSETDMKQFPLISILHRQKILPQVTNISL